MRPLAFRRLAAAVVTVVVLGGALSACGSSGASGATTATTSATLYQARLDLAKCFRAHGLNVPDPSPSGGPAEGGGVFRILRQYSQAQVTSAQQACRQYFAKAFPRFNLTPQQRAQAQQQIVKFAQCMRSHGIDIPDPQFNGNGGFGIRRALRSVDVNSPAFQAANKACASLRPRFGGRGPGGPGG